LFVAEFLVVDDSPKNFARMQQIRGQGTVFKALSDKWPVVGTDRANLAAAGNRCGTAVLQRAKKIAKGENWLQLRVHLEPGLRAV
jgi:hypothetical protein